MDLTGEMILEHFAARPGGAVAASCVRPRWHRRAERFTGSGAARNVDRIFNRLIDYPRDLKRLVKQSDFDLYHVVDHSYSQLLHVLPAGRAVVTCHDLDTFRCLLDPAAEPRPKWFRAMVRHSLRGLQKAAAVACNSETTRQAILAHGLLPPERLHVVHVGVAAEFTPAADPPADAEVTAMLGETAGAGGGLLHVGSNIPRKRIDVLLEVFAAVRRERPETRLWKVGGAFPPAFAEQARRLGVADAVVTLPFLSRAQLAAVYRRAALAVFPSDAEGFGFPLAEAMACGAPVLASAIPAFLEVGGPCARYAPVGDVAAWTAQALELLDARPSADEQAAALAWSSRFRWTTHVDQLAEIYRALLA